MARQVGACDSVGRADQGDALRDALLRGLGDRVMNLTNVHSMTHTAAQSGQMSTIANKHAIANRRLSPRPGRRSVS